MSNTQKLNFQLQPMPIDYFKLEEDYFKSHCNVSKEVISLSGNEKYIEFPKHFPNLDLDKRETIVFNFPVGKGKTTMCYDLIKEYDKKGWHVIVCSPFIRLVDKDLINIKDRINTPRETGFLSGPIMKICSYQNLSSGKWWVQPAYENYAYGCNIHIMTINCLLGNPGDNALDQSIVKSSYIDDLLKATEGKNVVLFIDELHESIHNFEPTFIANLLRWKNRVQKAYIASATFTPATIPAIKAVSLLTDSNVHIYESDRHKNNTQANIHLHITSYPINKYNKQFLEIVDKEITKYKTVKRPVNILTGTKSLGAEIAERSFKHVVRNEDRIGKHAGIDTVNLLTNETELKYQVGENNIGTTFKTGVDITDPDGVLFIVIPTITNNLNSQHYGIFTDGIPALVQSVGRLRNGGDKHIFISEPPILIDQSNTVYPSEFSSKKDDNHHSQNESYPILQKEYNNKICRFSTEISAMEAGISQSQYSSQSIEDKKNEFILWYPNLHEFLMDKSQRLLVNDYPSFGKYLSPYILWACLKDQFQNATLKEIIYHQPQIKKITITANNRTSTIQGLLSSLNNTIKQQSFRSFVDRFSDHLKESEHEDGSVYQHEYVFNGTGLLSNRLMKGQAGFTKEILEQVIHIKTGKDCSLSKRDYIMACLSDVQQGDVYHEIKIREAYRKLLELREKYIHWFKSQVVNKKGKLLISVDAFQELPDDLLVEAVETFSFLKENDKLISNNVISMLQKFQPENSDKNKAQVYKILEDLFINVTEKRAGSKKFYVLQENYVAEIQNSFSIHLI